MWIGALCAEDWGDVILLYRYFWSVSMGYQGFTKPLSAKPLRPLRLCVSSLFFPFAPLREFPLLPLCVPCAFA